MSDRKKVHTQKKQVPASAVKKEAAQKKRIGFHLPLLLLLLATFLAFYPSLNCDFVNWDDDIYVTDNPLVQNPNPENLTKLMTEEAVVNYHPITMLSLAFNYKWFGPEAFSFHLINLLIHLLNVYLVFVWIRMLKPDSWKIAFLTAGIFALHPLHVESVTWISERKDVLYTLFFLLALIQYHKYLLDLKSVKWLGLAFLFFLFSLLSKPAAVVFPLLLFLLDYLVRRKMNLTVFLEKIPFFGAAIALGIITIVIQKTAGAVEHTDFTLPERFLMAGYALMTYLLKFLAPINLSSFYPATGSPLPVHYLLEALGAFSLFAAAIWYFRKSRMVLFGIGFFFFNLILILQWVNVGNAIIAERYTYVPYIGLAFLLALGLDALIKRNKSHKQLITIGALSSLFLLGFLSFQRTSVWTNGETLWSNVIEQFPEDAGAWGGRGQYYKSLKIYPEALQDLNKAIALDPTEPRFFLNRGKLYFDQGQLDQAFYDYNQCIRLSPDRKEAYANRGAIYGARGMHTEAISDLDKAISLDPEFINAYKNRALVKGMMQDYQGSRLDWETILKLDPGMDDIWNALGVEHQRLGDFPASIICFTEAIRLQPNQGIYWQNRSISYKNRGEKPQALADSQRALQLGYPVPQEHLEQLK